MALNKLISTEVKLIKQYRCLKCDKKFTLEDDKHIIIERYAVKDRIKRNIGLMPIVHDCGGGDKGVAYFCGYTEVDAEW